MDFLKNFLNTLLVVLELAIIIRIIMSWFDPAGQNQVSRIAREVTEPVIGPIRRLVPSIGMFDLSPLIAILLINFLQQVVASVG